MMTRRNGIRIRREHLSSEQCSRIRAALRAVEPLAKTDERALSRAISKQAMRYGVAFGTIVRIYVGVS